MNTSVPPSGLKTGPCPAWVADIPGLSALIASSPKVHWPKSRQELLDLAAGGVDSPGCQVVYDIPGMGRVVEADVVRCRNGIAVNYPDPYMRRRDPDTMLIADAEPTDKPRFADRFGQEFGALRQEVLDWLGQRELVVLPFSAGGGRIGHDAVYVGPANAAFFGAALADLQGLLTLDDIDETFKPQAILYMAPPFRQTHCGGRQVVVHNRTPGLHEVFALNLYPGPSAKKGVYALLLDRGEAEGWVTAHASVVRVVTPYDNRLIIMHEGASGGGKSEMLEYPHREFDGRIVLGENLVTGERRMVPLTQGCTLEPVTDDMALCHPGIQSDQTKLSVTDAERAWFVRVDHVSHYGTSPDLERLCVEPPEPLIFLNLQGVAGATCLPWEHTLDAPGKRCPNPRVIIPRKMLPDIVCEPVEVDIRSFGVRTPPCTKDAPSFGILGLMHLLPPALAWLWRLVAPRGYANPSIVGGDALTSEGVGSFWPFATGRKVVLANLMLDQLRRAPGTRYVLIPNQHVGAWKVGFNAQWIAREYLARRGGAKFRRDQLVDSRCPLLGYALKLLQVEGVQIPIWFLRTELQSEIGLEAYDAGARMLANFFKREVGAYLQYPDLDPVGAEIIRACLNDADLATYEELLKPI